ncbi:DNA polymerase I [Kosmotoga pacifica]|uniref:DNA polymerase I n=1 Tax=Kosmotoga pacifica TaxID=1330330 RepID=A0A0G2ZB21_9BACT|nr:DNA polymerase I [Kosmotoga pacifica]AKI96789.1 DNA polymerase [Kosmotoga pacifica]
MANRLFLFDGTAIVYRAYFAIDVSLTNSKGEPTNALFGTARMLAKFIKEKMQDGDYALFAFDRKEATHRHKMFDEYKATRKEMPDALVSQLPWIPEMVEGFGIKFLSIPGLEADDIIATAATKFKDRVNEVIIVSGDKDILQLIDDGVKVLRFVTGLTDFQEYDEKKVVEVFGFPPSKLHDYLTLVGDNSDNIPGVKGIGEKTAKDLLKKYGSIENIYSNIRQLSPALRRKLVDGKQSMELSKKLIKLVVDADLKVSLDELKYTGPDKEKLREVFMNMEFASLIKEFGLYSNAMEERKNGEQEYKLISSDEELRTFWEMLRKSSFVSIDFETTSLDPHQAEIVGISFSFEEGKGYYLPVGHENAEWQPERETVISTLKEILTHPGLKIVGQNLKFDYEIMKKHGINPVVPHFDTMVGAYLLNPDSKRFNLDDLALKYLGYRTQSFEELMKINRLGDDFSKIPPVEAARYSIEDADIALRLYRVLSTKLYETGLDRVMEDIEMKLIPVLADLELNGIYIDADRLYELSKQYQKKLDILLSELFELAGENFNPNSPSQVAKILFGKLGLTPPKKTKQGAYSTSAQVLESIADEHPVVEKLLEYRKYQKLKSTYLDTLPKLINPITGRIHASFHQTGTGTGRLSSSNPNVQNLPIKDEAGKEIRRCIVPQRKGWKIVSADYSQIELRVLAHCSGDEQLIEAFKHEEDIHALTASRLYGITVDSVTEEMRKVGKMVNFAIIYGVSSYGLARRLKIPSKIAENMISNYFNAYPGVRKYIHETIEGAKAKGYVTTLFGRRREIPHFRTKNKTRIQEGERIAINTPIQGTAADIMKLAMIRVDELVKEAGLKGFAILQVHDELVFEVPETEVKKICDILHKGMTEILELRVPLKVDISVANYWA